MAELLLQNPDTAQTITLSLPPDAVVADVATLLMRALNIAVPPLLFAYLRHDACESLCAKTLVEGSKVVLPDDEPILGIIKDLQDPRLPIYFQTREIGEMAILSLRTRRLAEAGYDIPRLQAATVMIAGAGLLGGEIALSLGVAGVGHLIVLDAGIVDWLNLYRQPLFSTDDVYTKKVETSKRRLEQMRGVRVDALHTRVPSWTRPLPRELSRHTIRALGDAVATSDLVIAAFDNYSARAVLQQICLYHKRPFIAAAVDAGAGCVGVHLIGQHCYCCGTPDPRNGIWWDGGACTLASVDAQKIVSAVAVRGAIDVLHSHPIDANFFEYDPRKIHLAPFRRSRNQRCWMCGESGVGNDSLPDAVLTWVPCQEDGDGIC